jgi:hypothetical protein
MESFKQYLLEMELTSLSSEAIGVLRSCNLMRGGKDEAGVSFVRCGRNLGTSKAAQIASEICSKLGDSRNDVFSSYNEELGLNDYVRVNVGSKAYALICRLKS